MLERIIFLFCSLHSSFSLHAPLRENREALLAGYGIAYPDSPWSLQPEHYNHNTMVADWGKTPVLSEPVLHTVLQHLGAARTLILNISSPHRHAVNCLLWLKFRKLYPQAMQHAVVVFGRQDTHLEALLTAEMTCGPVNTAAWLQDSDERRMLCDSGQAVRRMTRTFGEHAVSVLMDDGTEEAAFRVRRHVLDLAGVPADQAKALLKASAPLPRLFRQPAGFLDFCQAHISLSGADTRDAVWSREVLRMAAHTPWPEPFPSLLGPQRRAAILEAYASVNAETARLLGLERLFPEPEPEPDWEPFTGLTEETAFQVAERLDSDFAQARMAEFDATPIHYLTRRQRLCRQALHDALDPPSPVSPPRAALPHPKLSVLTLSYNHAPYIAECMESVIAQKTNFPLQHIIADDGSDDGTREIILDYAARHPHIVPVFQKTRSRGWLNVQSLFDMARTEYVALCDGDDYFTDPGKLQTQADFLDAHPDCGLCFHVVRVLYEGGAFRERFYPPVEALPRGIRPFYYLEDLFKGNFIQTNSVMYRWRFRNGLPGWFRPDLTPGDWYWHLLHAETGKIGFINKIMSVYRRHKESVYYLSEVDRLKHRHVTGMEELTMYDVVNDHFEQRFEPVLLDLANGVFADCLLYGKKIDDFTLMDTLVDRFPRFTKYFLDSVEIVDTITR